MDKMIGATKSKIKKIKKNSQNGKIPKANIFPEC